MKTAPTRMDELGTDWLPVTDRTAIIGIVEQLALAAGLLLDVIKAMDGAR
jgi:hypothetical protein